MSHTPLMVDCGCKTMTHNPVIKYCSLHAAAPTLLEALKLLDSAYEEAVCTEDVGECENGKHSLGCYASPSAGVRKQVLAAIALAKGRG